MEDVFGFPLLNQLFCPPTCQQAGARGQRILPNGELKIRGSAIALSRVPGKSVAPGRNRPSPALTCHLPALGAWTCL